MTYFAFTRQIAMYVRGLLMDNRRDGRDVELIKSILIVKWPNFNESHIQGPQPSDLDITRVANPSNRYQLGCN